MPRLMSSTNLRVFLAALCLASGSFLLISTWTRQRTLALYYRKLHDEHASFLHKSAARKMTFTAPETKEELDKPHMNNESRKSFLLDTPYCNIPDIDPFDPAVIGKLKRRGELLCTGNKLSVTFSEGSKLRLNWEKIKEDLDGDFKYCQYQAIRRGNRNSDFSFELGDLSESFDHDITIPPQDEFLRVHCYSQSEGKVTTDFHATVSPKQDVERRSLHRFERHKENPSLRETYNVHMIGVDSVSRLNFIRHMRQTREFLHKDLGAFEMSGYNKVADNTFVNIVPMTMGKFVNEIGWNENMNNVPFDKYPFLWKNFSQAGYRTLYAEDAPKIAIFVYAKEGFHEPPADYYNRPLAVALEKQRSVWSSHHHCVADRLETTMVLDYVTDFSRVFRDKPHFGFTFITRLTHDKVDLVEAADYAYVNFLRRFRDEGHFKNTVLIFYSDHGYRFGEMRDSYVGKVEERLPFFYLVFPPSFREKYPAIVRNLQINSKRLTTPFDVYETVKDILYFDGVAKKGDIRNRGISMLREIPAERTCEHAQILPHWCLCLEQKTLKPKGKLANKIGQAVVRHMNNVLLPVSHMCANLTLLNISHIVRMASNERVLRFADVFHDVLNQTIVYGRKTDAPVVYQITMTTAPGFALFEATVTFDPVSRSFKMGGDISRINAYKDQSFCVDNFILKKFCYCLNKKNEK
ncbi:hypothetical protein PoB_000310800 [Plakobranchus ocellatus]|uniref:Sulfatase N-terminal domain-containing protein n=1 Tax=Plakobranchus ocellatus TaxID=259542 RepID=A0AAV3Y2Q2_9GAST|nr:hypothetical protein PoB_000310800 [Plakobranchus ocellatus]